MRRKRKKLSTRRDLRGEQRGENGSAKEVAVREGRRTLDKYHTAEPEASPQCFPLSAMNRDKAHGDASPNVITDRGRDSGVHGVTK